MNRTWIKLTIRLKREDDREKLYLWFLDRNPRGFWEQDPTTMVIYLDAPYLGTWPDFLGSSIFRTGGYRDLSRLCFWDW